MARRRIMVVEDSRTSREILSDIVSDLGYEARTAASAEEALEGGHWRHADAFVLDLRLPGMSGLGLLHLLKRERPRAVVILVTQYDHAGLDGALAAYENVWFFRKPMDGLTLSSVLKNAFETLELQRDVERLRSLSLGIESVGKVRDLNQEFRVLLHLAADSLSADAGVLFMLPEGSSRARIRCGTGVPGELPGEVEVGGFLARCSETGSSVVVRSARVARVPELSALFPRVRRLHVLACPLICGRKMVGVLELYRDQERSPFDEKDQALAKVYCATAAVALENLTLLSESRLALEEQRRAQEELSRSRRLASLGQLTAGLAHEIKNPLMVILGNVGLIRKKNPSGELSENLDRIQDQCRRVQKLIEDMRAMYQPSAQDRSRFRLRSLVEEALVLAPPPPGEPEVGVRVEMDGPGPSLEADFTQLLQVLVNLLTNAYESMRELGGEIEVVYRSTPEDHQLEVRDRGPGIAEADQARIFEPFFTTKGRLGTGLGLWISETIMRSHGGSLELENHPEGGALFTLNLPRQRGGERPLPVVTLLSDHPRKPRSEPRRILIVDDDHAVREYLRELLAEEGYETEEAATTRDAERLLEARRFHLVILDERLQGLSGREFFLRVIQPRDPCPTLLFTGSENPAESERDRIGLAAVLHKPASSAAILEAISTALREREARAERPA